MEGLGEVKMDNYQETILKFLNALKVDLIKDVKYKGKFLESHRCVCGQPIKTSYLFTNTKNGLSCHVGKSCLKHIALYLGWNKH